MTNYPGNLSDKDCIFADGGYTGKLVDWTFAIFSWVLIIVKRNEQRKFVVLPKR